MSYTLPLADIHGIVDNDFHQTHEIFRLFDDLEVTDMAKIPTMLSSLTNGDHPAGATNGVAEFHTEVNSSLRN